MTDWSLAEIAAVVENPKLGTDPSGEAVLRCGCPAHGGHDRNCAIKYGSDGKLLAHCHSRNCDFEAIVTALRERLGDPSGGSDVISITVGSKPKQKSTIPEGKKRRQIGKKTWEIRDQNAELIALHVRFDYDDGHKEVKWRLPSGEWSLKPAGLTPADMPLYGVREALRTPPDTPIVVTEGEKAADALLAHGIVAVGTVTGAYGTPGEAALALLRGRKVVLWPDADLDGQGHEHMGRVAAGLHKAGADVHWFEWDGAPDKGDAADYLELSDPQTLRKDLAERSVRWSRPPAIEGLIRNFGELMERGIEEPEELLPDILLKGKAHNIFGPGGIGKTWVLVWMAKELCEAGKRVVILDMENGLRTYMERFDEVGADRDALNRNFIYGAFLSFDRESYARLLDEEKPDLVMFDSWIGFLASDGRDENTANDIAMWADDYSKPALKRGVAVVVLDHVGHEHSERERGARRKRDEMDVVWKLKRSIEFNRTTRGSLEMFLEKDREGWLPASVAWEVGGGKGGFVMRREDELASLLTVSFLDSKERTVLTALKEHGPIRAKALQEITKMSKPTQARVLKRLAEQGKVINEYQEWAVIETPTLPMPTTTSSDVSLSQTVSETDETGDSGVCLTVSPLKGCETDETDPRSQVSPGETKTEPQDTTEDGSASGGLAAHMRRIRDERRRRS